MLSTFPRRPRWRQGKREPAPLVIAQDHGGPQVGGKVPRPARFPPRWARGGRLRIPAAPRPAGTGYPARERAIVRHSLLIATDPAWPSGADSDYADGPRWTDQVRLDGTRYGVYRISSHPTGLRMGAVLLEHLPETPDFLHARFGRLCQPVRNILRLAVQECEPRLSCFLRVFILTLSEALAAGTLRPITPGSRCNNRSCL